MNWLSLLAKALPYILCAVLGGIGVRKWDQGSYERLQADFASYREQDAIASQKAQEALLRQHEQDIQSSQGAINDLKAELEAVRATSPAPHVRLCSYATRNPVPPTPSGTAPGRTEPSTAPSGDVREVPTGVTVGPDVGAQLFALAGSADVLAAHCRAQLDYLRLITHNGPQ